MKYDAVVANELLNDFEAYEDDNDVVVYVDWTALFDQDEVPITLPKV